MGNVSFMDAVMYVLKFFKSVPNTITTNISNIVINVQTAIAGLSTVGTHSDVSVKEDNIYSSLATNFWLSAINSVITIVVAIISLIIAFIFGSVAGEDVVYGLLTGGLSGLFGIILTFSSVSSTIFLLAIASLIVYFGKKYSKKINMVVVKILIVLCFVSMVGCAISILLSLGSVLINLLSFSISNILTSLISAIVCVGYISSYGSIAAALGSGNGYNVNPTNTNDNVGNFNNTYGNMNNDSININKDSVTNNSETNNANVQMYACPYCGKGIYQNQSPCPHCNQPVNW